eukprot:TRINITY_DN11414_c0_g1_i3.p1 TRINITY_DN11414_c0_g1~~TRINITY_DN11414_c0_g1_i3.p1  ORF type:complete len:383 (+),score=81.33 TRINITY_DN11414_c0_g1_i3:55-1203(+)
MRVVQGEAARELASPALKTRALRCKSDGQLLPPTLLPRPPSQSVAKKDALPEQASATDVRVAQLEEKLASEQSQRLELELRLTQHLHKTVSEEFDSLKRQFAEEQIQRQALKTELNVLRSRLLGQALPDSSDVVSRLRRMEEKLENLGSYAETESDKKSPSWAVSTTASYDEHSYPMSCILEAECEQTQLGHRASSPVPGLRSQLTPRTLLRQENLSLREQMLVMREKAVEAKERERTAQSGEGLHQGLSQHKQRADVHVPRQWQWEQQEVRELELSNGMQKLEQATPKVLPPVPAPTPAASPTLPRRSVTPCCAAPHQSPKMESRTLPNEVGVFQMQSAGKGARTPTLAMLGGKGGPPMVSGPGGKGAVPVYVMRPADRSA